MSTSKTHYSQDKRTAERQIKKGALSRKEHEKSLKALPDASDKVDRRDMTPDAKN